MRTRNVTKQISLQRAVLFAYTVCAGLLLVYALGFLTNTYLFFAYGDQELVGFYRIMQWVNRGFLWKAVAGIIFAALFFGLELAKHAAGVVTLIITCFASLATIALNVLTLLELLRDRAEYLALNFSGLDLYINRGTITYNVSAATYDIGIALSVLFIAVAAFFCITVVRNAFVIDEAELEQGGTV